MIRGLMMDDSLKTHTHTCWKKGKDGHSPGTMYSVCVRACFIRALSKHSLSYTCGSYLSHSAVPLDGLGSVLPVPHSQLFSPTFISAVLWAVRGCRHDKKN